MSDLSPGDKVRHVATKSPGVVVDYFPLGPIYFVKFEDDTTNWLTASDVYADDHNAEILVTPAEYSAYARAWCAACCSGIARWGDMLYPVPIGEEVS